MAKFSVIPIDNTKLMCYNNYTNKERSDLNGQNHEEHSDRRNA